jgi:hypothetical protein
MWARVGYFLGTAAGQDLIDRLILYVLAGVFVLAIGGYLVRRLIRRLRHIPKDETPTAVEESICGEERGK